MVIEFIIDYKGEVVSPQVIEAQSKPADSFAEPFAKSAVAALKQWTFGPGKLPVNLPKHLYLNSPNETYNSEKRGFKG